MSHNHVERVQTELEAEVARIFEAVREKKRRVTALIGQYLENESRWKGFQDVFAAQLHDFEVRRALLERERADRQRRLNQLSESALLRLGEESGGFVPRFEAISQPETAALRPEGAPSPDPLPDLGALGGSEEETSTAGPSPGSALPGPETPLPPPDPKRLVARAFQRMYHPRRIHDDPAQKAFYEERAKLINEMLADPDFDEVDVLLRMPFSAEDERAWAEPLAEREPVGERWERFRLWERLLEVAIERAERTAQSATSEAYRRFQEWRAGDKELLVFIGEIKQQRGDELHRLEAQIAQLQAELDKRSRITP